MAFVAKVDAVEAVAVGSRTAAGGALLALNKSACIDGDLKTVILIFTLRNCTVFAFSGRFIGRPQTFVEPQLRLKMHFYTRKMQFET